MIVETGNLGSLLIGSFAFRYIGTPRVNKLSGCITAEASLEELLSRIDQNIAVVL